MCWLLKPFHVFYFFVALMLLFKVTLGVICITVSISVFYSCTATKRLTCFYDHETWKYLQNYGTIWYNTSMLAFFLIILLHIFEKQACHEFNKFFNCFYLPLLTRWSIFTSVRCTLIKLKACNQTKFLPLRVEGAKTSKYRFACRPPYGKV